MQNAILKQGDVIEFTAEAFGSNGEAVGKCGNYTVFCDFVLPGERAKARVTYVKKSVVYAELKEILTSSPDRVEPVCPHFGKCGGCTLQHASFSAELEFKRNLVARNLEKIGKITFAVDPVVTDGKRFGYRNKISLPAARKNGKTALGMYRKNTHEIVPTAHCALTEKWADDVIFCAEQYFKAVGATAYDERTFSGEIRHVAARFVDGQLLVTLVTNGKYKRDLTPLCRLLTERFGQFGLFVNVNTSRGNVILGEKSVCAYGKKYIEGSENGIKFFLQPDSFFQVNDGVRRLLYDAVKKEIAAASTEALIDCFAGAGLLTFLVSDDSKYQTYSIEISPSAVADARKMALANGSKATAICGDVEKELPVLTEKLRGKKVTLLFDPPRKGLGEKICQTVLSANAQTVVYVSCDSATLARDAALLSPLYALKKVTPFNMFPSTPHVETLATFYRK